MAKPKSKTSKPSTKKTAPTKKGGNFKSKSKSGGGSKNKQFKKKIPVSKDSEKKQKGLIFKLIDIFLASHIISSFYLKPPDKVVNC